MNVNSVSCEEKENVNDSSNIAAGHMGKVGAEKSRFPFTSKPGINVDLEDLSNLLEYCE
jgi:hypothetical protein